MTIVAYNNDNQAPIGLFDSGVGGLSIYQHLYHLLKQENYLYYADTLNVPYGKRDAQQIIELTLKAIQWLYDQGCKLIIVACNSASAYGLEIARKQFIDVPIVGLVPALKPAVLASQTKHIAVLATQATLKGPLLNEVIREIAEPNNVKVSNYFEPDLVPWVEQGMPTQSQTANTLRDIVTNFDAQSVDYLVLGCTHYPFFRSFIETHIADNNLQIQLIDSGSAIALRVEQVLKDYQLLNNNVLDKNASQNIGYLQVYASQFNNNLVEIINRLLPQEVTPLFDKNHNSLSVEEV